MPDYRYRVVAFGPTGQARVVAGPALDTTPDADRRWADIADSMGNDWDGLTYTAERQEVTPDPPWETIPLRQDERRN